MQARIQILAMTQKHILILKRVFSRNRDKMEDKDGNEREKWRQQNLAGKVKRCRYLDH